MKMGQLEEAAPLFRRALAARERRWAPSTRTRWASVNNRRICCRTRASSGGGALFRRALEASERTLGAEHPDTLTSEHPLPQHQGQLEEAAPLFRRAPEVRERTLGADHPDTLTSWPTCGLLQAQGQLEEAAPRSGVTWRRERTLGAEHPDTLTDEQPGVAAQAQGQLEGGAAVPACAGGARADAGADHPDTLVSVANLRRCCRTRASWKRRRRCSGVCWRRMSGRWALIIRTLVSVNNLAGLLYAQGQLEEAAVPT